MGFFQPLLAVLAWPVVMLLELVETVGNGGTEPGAVPPT